MEYVRYIDRTREYYANQGYEKPYHWANHETVPFTPLTKPLTDCRLGLLSTSEIAIRFDETTEENPIREEGFRSLYMIASDTPTERLYSRTSSFDRNATTLDDVNAFFPVDRLREAVASGRIGAIPERLYGAYNNYSKRKVLEEEAPAALAACREDEVDAVLMIPV